MNDNKHYSDLEAEFQRRSTLLDSLLENDAGDDETHLYPAWNSLHKDEKRYSSDRYIAEGGEKRIEAAFDRISQREVAIARPLGATLPEKERFLKEARLTAFLEHPNIMPVYDIGLDEEIPYFTMELFHGENLAKKRGSGKLSNKELNEYLVFFVRICDAIAYAHSKGISHLDIKPANIQLGSFGEVLLCDWGLAKVSNEDAKNELPEQLDSSLTSDLTILGKMKGTPGYMSPTLARGEKGGAQDDIYALGATLYFILSGICPHHNEDVQKVIEATKESEVQPAAKLFPHYEISASLEAVALKALSTDKSYKSVSHLQKEVTNYLRGYATEAEEAGFMTQLKLLYQRQKTLCNIIVAVFILIIALTSFFIHSLQVEREREAVARQQAEQSTEMYKGELRFNRHLMKGIDKSLKRVIKEVDNNNLPVDIRQILVKVGRGNISMQAFEAAAQILETLAQQSSGETRLDALHDLAFCKIMMHDFNGALKLLKKLSDEELQRAKIYTFIPLCEEFKHKVTARGVLGLEDFERFISLVTRPRLWFFPNAFTYYLRKCRNDEEVCKLLKLILNWWNRTTGVEVELSMQGNLKTLVIRKALGLELKSMGEILEVLKIHSIDLGKLRVRSLDFLKKNQLVEIDISRAQINNSNFLLHCQNLQRVFIRKGSKFTLLERLKNNGVLIIEK
ncbi:MAG: serine/threonine protein kinase [Lentisphaeraceae bacterium]|nr:serine/threonine protein kinase [Lentisphaeraceae bacterium]